MRRAKMTSTSADLRPLRFSSFLPLPPSDAVHSTRYFDTPRPTPKHKWLRSKDFRGSRSRGVLAPQPRDGSQFWGAFPPRTARRVLFSALVLSEECPSFGRKSITGPRELRTRGRSDREGNS